MPGSNFSQPNVKTKAKVYAARTQEISRDDVGD
jgi:hypothetical protein